LFFVLYNCQTIRHVLADLNNEMAAPKVHEELVTIGQEVTGMLHSIDRDPARIAQIKARLLFLQRSGRLPPVITYSLLALIAELENDRESAIDLARRSIAAVADASDDSSTSFTNALAVLARFSLYQETLRNRSNGSIGGRAACQWSKRR
jgi:hypothetical protein